VVEVLELAKLLEMPARLPARLELLAVELLEQLAEHEC
jgi:hypothetical protein